MIAAARGWTRTIPTTTMQSTESTRPKEAARERSTASQPDSYTRAAESTEDLPDRAGDATPASPKTVATDGGYVVATGEGYLGRYSVTPDRTVTLGHGVCEHLGWGPGEPIYFRTVAEGVAIVQEQPDSYLVGHATTDPATAQHRINVRTAALEELGVAAGDDVRVYERDAGGVVLVPADDDPRVATDGGVRLHERGQGVDAELGGESA